MSKELDELQELARVATLKALENYIIPDEYKTNLVLGVRFDEGRRIFELYVPGENSMDALVIATAIADKDTKSVTVNVSNLELKS